MSEPFGSAEQLDLDTLQALADAATPGPWVYGTGKRVCLGDEGPTLLSAHGDTPDDRREENCEFTAAARQAVPALIAEVRLLQEDFAGQLDKADRAEQSAVNAWRALREDKARLRSEVAAATARASEVPGLSAALDEARGTIASLQSSAPGAPWVRELDALRAENEALKAKFTAERALSCALAKKLNGQADANLSLKAEMARLVLARGGGEPDA